ncbi:MAG TPA: hypothetical protein VHB72_01765 [Candidatus Saccharimonadales bacterium]|nr:hypothetical protein [Candidatus Saccharimonadales bacterium]
MKDNYAATFAAKWPEDVANRGFAPIPKCLITCMNDLDLKPQEAAVLFNIIEKCWKAGDVAWQKVDTLATNIGRKNSATREITKSLAGKGFITKTQHFNTSNTYSLEPLAGKLATHMKECRYTAGNSEGYRRKSGSPDSRKPDSHDRQKAGDYIEPDYVEPELNRNPDIEFINNSRSFNNEADDELFSDDNYRICSANPLDDRHEWREFEVEKYKDEQLIISYYFTCIHCEAQYHKDGERPWPAKYPSVDN